MSPSSDPYRSSQKLGAGARQTEARALMETARALADAQENMEDLSSYRAALRLNWRLWTIFSQMFQRQKTRCQRILSRIS